MILAHLSELHLGFRRWERTHRGRNVRERDVAAAFERAVHELERARPDMIVITGDVFDVPDPGPAALLALVRALDALRSALPEAPIALVAGARDTPLVPGVPGMLSVLGERAGVSVATGTLHEVKLPELDMALALVPHRAGLRSPFPVPEPDARRSHNVLAAWGRPVDGEGVHIDPAAWSYVALGGSHVRRAAAPNVHYAGSLERVGPDPWVEGAEDKGFLLVDLDTGRTHFRSLPVRPVVSLAPIRRPDDPADLRHRVKEVTDEVPGGLVDKVVRLRFRDASPRDLLGLQGSFLVELRARSLHLDLEARGEADAETPSSLREYLVDYFRDRGESDAGERMEALLETAAGELAELPIRLRVEDSVLGSLDLALPEGLSAVVASEPSLPTLFFHLLTREPGERPVPPWLGTARRPLRDLVDALVEALLRGLGAGGLLDEVQRLREGASVPAGQEPREELERRLAELQGAEEELRGLEEEVRSLRADHAEVVGDLESAAMGWMRERQDAETHLLAYRDRARELKGRLERLESGGADAACPTCGRILQEHHGDVSAALREEWEAVVQDGSWWRRRREQLELKPDALQELEGRALRLQAAVEACAERLEGVRSRVRERDELRAWLARDEGEGTSLPVPAPIPVQVAERPSGHSVELLEEGLAHLQERIRERLLDRASRYLGRLTSSRLLALTWRAEGGVELEGCGGPVRPPGDGDLAAAEAGLLLAGLVQHAEVRGPIPGALLPEALVEALPQEEKLHLLDLLAGLRGRVRRLLVGCRLPTAEARSDRLDSVLELRVAAEGTGAVRRYPGGAGRLLLRPLPPPGSGAPPPLAPQGPEG